MNITYNIDKLKEIVDDMCALTGVAMAIADTKRNFLYFNLEESNEFCSFVQSDPRCREKCRECDKAMCEQAGALRRPFSHICHAGLWDAGVPIIKGGVTVGYVICGRVRESEKTDDALFESLAEYGLDREALKQKYSSVHLLSERKKKSLLRLLSHVLFERAIEIDYGSFMQRATELIDQNISERLSVESLCACLFVSKNYLYRNFRSFFGKTVNEYITDRRIQKAKEMLCETSASAREIAEAVGFENYTYFTKLFKKKTGMSPSVYRTLFVKEGGDETKSCTSVT